MNVLKMAIPVLVALAFGPSQGLAGLVLGPNLETFAVLGATAVTNASAGGPAATIINGNLGVSPGSSITGFPPGTVSGAIQPGTEAAAQLELTSAYISLGGAPLTGSILAGGLSGVTLAPGVTPGPTQGPSEPAAAGGGTSLIVLLLLVLAALVAGGAGMYYVIRRRGGAPPPVA